FTENASKNHLLSSIAGELDANELQQAWQYIEKVAAPSQRTALSLRWCLAQPHVASVLLGASSAQQLQQSLNCFANFSVNDGDLQFLQDYLPKGIFNTHRTF
ncbi:MAG: aldo/keto reductase, partial [Bacilli bacterium]